MRASDHPGCPLRSAQEAVRRFVIRETLLGRVVVQVAHRAFPHAVEIEADEVAVGIERRAAGVAAGGVVGTQKAYRQAAVFGGIWTVVF